MMKKTTNWARVFYDEVEPIRLRDPLGEILGAVEEGEPFTYTFKEAVLISGHSCPAVSGAYLVTLKALKTLYADEMPVRGHIEVLIKGKASDLSYGPQSQVIMLITGASGETGFKGLGGRHGRCNLLHFDPTEFQFNTYFFRRTDTGRTVKVTYDPQTVPEDPRISTLIKLVLSGTAVASEAEEFRNLWQEKVRKILIDYDEYPGLVEVTEVTGFTFPGDTK